MKKPPTYLRGDLQRITHRASVVSILGAAAPEVISRGSQFANVDRWPLRRFIAQMCNWAQLNPQKEPNVNEISEWVRNSNKPSTSKRQIILAATPYRLPRRLAMALVGGAYHEAWHTLYSCRRHLTIQEMSKILIPRWTLVPDWSIFGRILLDLTNLIEDIRIERLGTQEFPGAWTKMHDLQDYILQQESLSEETEPNTLITVGRLFREYGLGYSTNRVREALGSYKEKCPHAYTLVVDGPLRPLLEKTISLTKAQDIACLEISMDLLILLTSLTLDEEEDSPEPEHRDTAQNTLDQISKGERLLNLSYEKLASQHIQRLRKEEDEDLGRGEAPYRAYNPSLDVFHAVGPSLAGKASDRRTVRRLLREVRSETTFLRARLRALVLDLAERQNLQASRTGTALSLPNLVRTKVEITNKQHPHKPYETLSVGIAPSTAAAVVIDESSSMRDHLRVVQKAVLILLDALDSVQCPTSVLGFRDGVKADPAPSKHEVAQGNYHRTCGVEFDTFKTFGESFYQVNWKLANIKTVGSTPMADGLHQGINLLKSRVEKHRVLFLITDGQPTGYVDQNPEAVVRGQISRATQEGIHVVAIGFGEHSKPVTHLFPDHVWSLELEQMPKLMLEKLRELFQRRRNVKTPDFE